MSIWQIGIVSGIIGGLAVLVIGLALPRRKCPDCASVLPRMRKPENAQQALWGRSTCPQCGCEIDRRGIKIDSSSVTHAIEPPSAGSQSEIIRKRSMPKLVFMAISWTLMLWFTSMIFIGAMAGALDPRNGAQAGARAGEAFGGLCLLLSLGLSIALTVWGKLPGTRKVQGA